MSKLITVFGATGSQGGSVVRYLLEHPTEFAVRAVTRNPSSPAAKALAEKRCEVVQGDAGDKASCERACAGAWGVYGVTDFFAAYYSNGMDAKVAHDTEVEHGKNIVDASKHAKVFVWSTLDHTPTGAPHWEAKHAVDEYAKTQVPTVSLYTSAYYENIDKFGMLKRDSQGYALDFCMPTDIPFLLFSVNEVGGWALAAFQDPARWVGKDMHALGEYISTRDMAMQLAQVLDAPVHAAERSVEQFHDPTFKSAIDLELWLNMAIFVDDDRQQTMRDAALSKEAFPKASTFAQWARHDADFKAYVAKLKE